MWKELLQLPPLGLSEATMPQYFFDVMEMDKRRKADAVGLLCNDDVGAIATAKFLATQIAIEEPKYDCQRHVIVLNDAGTEIYQAPVAMVRPSKLRADTH
jgi:hypothetical protein